MSGNWKLSGTCLAISLFRFITAIFLTTVDIETRSIVIFENRYNWAVILVLVLDFVNDLLIAAGLSYYLSQSRSGIDKYENTS